MSLFKAREWWSTLSGYEEFHTTGSLLITSITSQDGSTKNVVVVGSFSGILRVYVPSHSTFSPDHLLLEKELSLPIIKLGVAKLTSEPTLVVLHSQQVSIFSLLLKEDELTLLPINQHLLSHTSYDMIIGRFGRINNDLICVQSVDGLLQVFDHNSSLLNYYISDTIIPGPLAYVPSTDSILTVTSARNIEGYYYQSLSKGSKKVGTKKSKCDWTLQLGDPVVDIRPISIDNGPSVVLVLGERNLFCLKDTGAVIFSHKLEAYCTCILPYKLSFAGEDNSLTCMYMVSTQSQQLQIFSNQLMIWSAQLPCTPISLAIGKFDGLDGIVVTLDELGHLQCNYLGTDPTSFAPSLTSNTAISVQEMETELRQLQSAIEECDNKGVSMSDSVGSLDIKSVSYSEVRPLESEDDENIEQQCIEAKVVLHCTDPLLCDINIRVEVVPPISVHPVLSSIDNITDNELLLTFVCSSTHWASTHKAYLIVTYSNHQGHTLSVNLTLSLPLMLFCKPIAPHDGQYKVTLDSTHKCIPLSEIYKNSEVSEGQSNAVAFQLLTGQCVTMIASKTSNRYRLQSNSFPALSGFIEDMIMKLKAYHKDSRFSLSLTSALPLSEYFECIEEHYKVRIGLQQCHELLNRHSHQFRAIQKRLLARYKDKTPAGLVNLDALLDGTFMQLMALTEKCEELQSEEDHALRELTSASHLLISLVQLSVKLPAQDVCVLKNVLTPTVSVNAVQGWEELVDVAVTQLLRTALAKASKDRLVNLPELELPSDCKRLKRHIALMFDRIVKGGRLTGTQSLNEENHHKTLPTVREESDQ